MKTTIYQDFKRMVALPLTDIPLFFTAKYYKENWNKHFNNSILIMIPIMILLVLFTGITETNFYFMGTFWNTSPLVMCFVGYGMAFSGNYVREWYLSVKKDAPFSLEDCRYGGYAGAIVAILLKIVTAFI